MALFNWQFPRGTFTGTLQRIGTGTVFNGSLTKASIIEIGDHSLKDVMYDNYINNYLTDALKSDDPISIMLWENKIVAIRINGKNYYSDRMPPKKVTFGKWLLILLVGAISMGIGGVIIFIVATIEAGKVRETLNEFESVRA